MKSKLVLKQVVFKYMEAKDLIRFVEMIVLEYQMFVIVKNKFLLLVTKTSMKEQLLF
jgi:hypothetical protein